MSRSSITSTAVGEMHEIYAPKWQIAEPHISPDGKNIAFIEGLMSDEGSTGGDIFIVPIGGGTPQNLTPGINSSPSSLEWIAADQILFTSKCRWAIRIRDGQQLWRTSAIFMVWREL